MADWFRHPAWICVERQFATHTLSPEPLVATKEVTTVLVQHVPTVPFSTMFCASAQVTWGLGDSAVKRRLEVLKKEARSRHGEGFQTKLKPTDLHAQSYAQKDRSVH